MGGGQVFTKGETFPIPRGGWPRLASVHWVILWGPQSHVTGCEMRPDGRAVLPGAGSVGATPEGGPPERERLLRKGTWVPADGPPWLRLLVAAPGVKRKEGSARLSGQVGRRLPGPVGTFLTGVALERQRGLRTGPVPAVSQPASLSPCRSGPPSRSPLCLFPCCVSGFLFFFSDFY